MDNESSCWQTDNRFQLIIIKKIQKKNCSRCWHFHLCSVSSKNFNPIKFPFSAIVNHSIVSSRFYFSLCLIPMEALNFFFCAIFLNCLSKCRFRAACTFSHSTYFFMSYCIGIYVSLLMQSWEFLCMKSSRIIGGILI